MTYDIPWPQESLKSDFFSLSLSLLFSRKTRDEMSDCTNYSTKPNIVAKSVDFYFLVGREDESPPIFPPLSG